MIEVTLDEEQVEDLQVVIDYMKTCRPPIDVRNALDNLKRRTVNVDQKAVAALYDCEATDGAVMSRQEAEDTLRALAAEGWRLVRDGA